MTFRAMVGTRLFLVIFLDGKFTVGRLDSFMLNDAVGLIMATSAFGVASSAEAKTDLFNFTFYALFAKDFRTVDNKFGVIGTRFSCQVLNQILWRY